MTSYSARGRVCPQRLSQGLPEIACPVQGADDGGKGRDHRTPPGAPEAVPLRPRSGAVELTEDVDELRGEAAPIVVLRQAPGVPPDPPGPFGVPDTIRDLHGEVPFVRGQKEVFARDGVVEASHGLLRGDDGSAAGQVLADLVPGAAAYGFGRIGRDAEIRRVEVGREVLDVGRVRSRGETGPPAPAPRRG